MLGMTTRKVATVFGGAGFIGRYVVQRLARQDFVVRVGTTDPAGAAGLQTSGRVGQIVPIVVNLTNEAAVARAVDGADLVVNLVGILSERRAGDFLRLQAEGAGRVARLATQYGVVDLVQVSAIGADPGAESLYARSKGEGERLARDAFPRAVILRPSLVFGPEDQFFNRFAALARVLPFMPVISGDSRFQPVYVGDVADAVLAAVGLGALAAGRTYELGGPRVATFRDLLRLVLELTRRRRPLLEVPMGLARVQARLGELLPNPPLTRDQLLLLGRDNVVGEDATTLADLGIPAKAMEAILPGYLARYRAGGGHRDVLATP